MAKVFERIVYDQYTYLEKHNILCKYQSGFRAIYSADTAFMKPRTLGRSWTNNIDSGKINAVVISPRNPLIEIKKLQYIWKRAQIGSVIFRESYSNVFHQLLALSKLFIKSWRPPGDDFRATTISGIYQRSSKLSIKLQTYRGCTLMTPILHMQVTMQIIFSCI